MNDLNNLKKKGFTVSGSLIIKESDSKSNRYSIKFEDISNFSEIQIIANTIIVTIESKEKNLNIEREDAFKLSLSAQNDYNGDTKHFIVEFNEKKKSYIVHSNGKNNSFPSNHIPKITFDILQKVLEFKHLVEVIGDNESFEKYEEFIREIINIIK